jgi:excisionase family DNA binding protein
MERLTYTVNEVAELLGLSRSKTYELVAGGAIPVLAIPGRRKLVARATLQQQLVEPSPNRQAPALIPTPMTMTLRASTTRHAHPSHHSQRSLPNRVIPLTQWHQGCLVGRAGPGSRFGSDVATQPRKKNPKP